MKPLVLLPTYREMQNLPSLTARLWEVAPETHVCVVDDASGDGIPEWVRSHDDFGRRLFLIARPGKQGLGTAYLAGFQWALERDYTHILQMDADGQHDPAALPQFVAACGDGTALVLGSRYRDGVRIVNWPIRRLLLSLGASYYVRILTGMPFTDPTSGYKCFSHRALEQIDLSEIRSNGYAFQIETTFAVWRRGLAVTEIPIFFEGRHAGHSKMSGAIAREAAWQVLRLAWLRWSQSPGSRP
jgi:dolichol-phosphate mannosyltransferase